MENRSKFVPLRKQQVETLDIKTSMGDSRILFGFDWKRVEELINSERVVIITDDNVRSIYGHEFPSLPVLSVTPGEKSKSLDTITKLTGKLLSLRVDRNWFILGIGGGVVSDITGFLASIFMRGVRYGFISTTLLSQVDASIGGKNGVNCCGVKNIIGVFNQPEFVICSSEFLYSLPEEEYRSGLSELVKTALIRDINLFSQIEENCLSIQNIDAPLLKDLIFRAVSIKAKVVEEDMCEKNVRMILNFGHTLGHAVESEYGISHGQAVAWGMMAAADFSVRKGYFSNENRSLIQNLFNRLKIFPQLEIEGNRIVNRMQNDKKRTGEEISFVFIASPGNCFTEKVSIEELSEFIRENWK